MKIVDSAENEIVDHTVAPVEIPIDEPGGFNVVILNDPITPAEVVVEALMCAVGLSAQGAIKRMMRTHRSGWTAVAAYASRDIAETVADKIQQHAASNTTYDIYRLVTKYNGAWPLAAEVMEAKL